MRLKNPRVLIGIIIAILIIGALISKAWIINVSNTDNHSKEEKEITILLPHVYLPQSSYNFIEIYRKRYEKETGIKVGIERLMASNRDSYLLKRNSRLYMGEGPTLLLIPYHESCRELVEKGVALKVKGKIDNLDKLYSGIKDDYYVPIKIHGETVSVNRKLLEKWGVEEPAIDWTLEDYDRLWKRWTDTEEVYFNRNLFHSIVEMMTRDIKFVNLESNTVQLNNGKIKQLIKDIQNEVFSGKYILNENYSYENYYRMFHDMSSVESRDSWDRFISNSAKGLIMNSEGHHYNGLSSIRTDIAFRYINSSLLLPDVRRNGFHTIGFIVNRNGKNSDLGLDFLNYLLSDEIQLDLYVRESKIPDSTNGTVNKNIIDEIESMERVEEVLDETLELRKYMTSLLEEKDYKHVFYGRNLQEQTVRNRFITELIPIVFADEPYSEKELSNVLKKLEQELTIYINE